MTSTLGGGLVLAGLAFAVVGAILGFASGYQRSIRGWRATTVCAIGFATTMLFANLLMVQALLNDDFSVKYVAEVGSRDTHIIWVKVASLWASLNGSILFWGGILGAYVGGVAVLHRDAHREYMPYALGVLMSISVFFSLLIATVANPFAAMDPVPLDGGGANPLLQNHVLMAIHPPMLYLGYVGMAVPFAFCAAALLAGRLDAGWMAPLRRWTLVPWTFLTIGIMLGGWWSYEVLGWGGYWAWDPVENASFMPWLTGTAFIHSAMVLHRKATLRTWTLVLGMSTFLLTMLGTFMTRSGVFNSVHSFTQSDIGPIFLGFIGVCSVFSILLLATREHVLVAADLKEGNRFLPTDMVSREMAVLLQNLAFAVFTACVLLGTLYPLISEQLSEKRVSVGEPFFDLFALPIGILIVFLMGVGPALPWGRMPADRAMWRFVGPLSAALAAAGVVAAAGFRHPWPLLAIAVSAFALWANLGETLEPALARRKAKGESLLMAAWEVMGRSRRRLGGHVAHYGVVMGVVAIAMSSGYKVEKDVLLHPGESATLGAFSATFTGVREEKEPHRTSTIASFALTVDGASVGVLEPRLNFYGRMGDTPIGTPSVYTRGSGDFYVSLTQIRDDGGTVSVRLMTMPLVMWVWVSAFVVAFGSVLVLWPGRVAATAPVAAAAPEVTA
jgi:cytochrome c-type biogenesis protein CcmF